MVGRDESSGDNGEELPRVCSVSKGAAVRKARTGVPECRAQALESGARSIDFRTCRCVAPETLLAFKLHDQGGGGPLLKACSQDATPGEVLPDRLVYWQPPKRYFRS